MLLDADYTARLTDFGYASLVGNIPEAYSYLQRSTARPGALRWIAPEQVDPEETSKRTTKSDIYSFGCIALQGRTLDTMTGSVLMLLQVLSGKQPWSEVREDSAVVLRLAKGHKPGRPESRAMHDSYWDLIQDCWSPIERRPLAEAIISVIQGFLSDVPQLPPLCDLLMSGFDHVDPLVDTSQAEQNSFWDDEILRREENAKQRLADELRYSDPSVVELWRQQLENVRVCTFDPLTS